MKREKKDNNIVIFDLEEKGSSTPELLKQIQRKLKVDLDITLEDNSVNKIFRIGSLNKEQNKPRPVLISFVNNWVKNDILKNKKKLKELYITEDYSKEVLEKRKSLIGKLIEERKKGKIAYLKYDKLIIKENTENKEKRKREASTSPQTEKSVQSKKYQALTSTSTQNRVNAFDIMRQRSSSLSTTNLSEMRK